MILRGLFVWTELHINIYISYKDMAIFILLRHRLSSYTVSLLLSPYLSPSRPKMFFFFTILSNVQIFSKNDITNHSLPLHLFLVVLSSYSSSPFSFLFFSSSSFSFPLFHLIYLVVYLPYHTYLHVHYLYINSF